MGRAGRLTGAHKYLDMAVKVGDNLISQQSDDGSWSSLDSDGPSNDFTAEMVVWLDEIYQVPGRCPMEIRAIRESELEQMVKLQCLTFDSDRYQRYWHYIRGDSSYRFEQTRVVIVDGQIAATLRIWDRDMRIGSQSVRMGGIGGVGTHPDHRRAGYASEMMKDAIDYMHSAGYEISVLISTIPQSFYRKLGYESMPMEGFRTVVRRSVVAPVETDWQVQPFDERRDLEQVVALYDMFNANQSASIVRSRAHWETMPARLRGTLPNVVARRGDTLGGYLNFEVNANTARVDEIAYHRNHPIILSALSNHLMQVCQQKKIRAIHGNLPHRHPLIDRLVEDCDGDLYLTGDSTMMFFAVNLPQLLRKLLPDWQSRLDAAHRTFDSLSISIKLNDQQRVLHLNDAGTLHILDADPNAYRLELPGEFFWRACLGESSWSQLETIMHARGIHVLPEISRLLTLLFPRQEVVFWTPDQF